MNLTKNNPQAKWGKSTTTNKETTLKSIRPTVLAGDLELDEELILASSDKTRNQANTAAVSWRKTAEGGRRGVQIRKEDEVEEEELVLAPKGPREGQVAQSASWQKQSSGACRWGSNGFLRCCCHGSSVIVV